MYFQSLTDSPAATGQHWPATLVLAIPSGLEGLPPVLDKPVDNPGSKTAVNAWVCQGVTCLLPVSDLETLKKTCKQAAGR